MKNLKMWGMILLGFGVIGFIAFSEKKDKFEVFEIRYTTTGNYSEEIDVLTGDEYLVSVWGSDDETGLQQWASVDYIVRLIDNSKNLVIEERITDTDSEEKGGIIRAQNGFDHAYVPDYTGKLFLNTEFIEGDEMTINIYRNLPDRIYYMPVLFIVMFIVGLFLFLKSRKAKS